MPTSSDGRVLGAEDHVVFQPDEDEDSDVDGWFDQLVGKQLSSLSLSDPDVPGPSLPDDSLSQLFDESLFWTDSQVVDDPFNLGGTQPDEEEKVEKDGGDPVAALLQVARPLQHSEEGLIPQSPKAREKPSPAETDLLSITSSSPGEERQAIDTDRVARMQRIAELKAQLADLESMERDLDTKDGWGA